MHSTFAIRLNAIVYCNEIPDETQILTSTITNLYCYGILTRTHFTANNLVESRFTLILVKDASGRLRKGIFRCLFNANLTTKVLSACYCESFFFSYNDEVEGLANKGTQYFKNTFL